MFNCFVLKKYKLFIDMWLTTFFQNKTRKTKKFYTLKLFYKIS